MSKILFPLLFLFCLQGLSAQTTVDSFFYQKVTKKLSTVYSMGKHYNYDYNYLLDYNELEEKSILRLGDSIKIPLKKHHVHKVKKADKSLWRIAKNYNIPLEDLKTYNFKKNNFIILGEQLVFPKEWTKASYEEQFFKYLGRNYKLEIRAYKENTLCHYRIRWYRERSNKKWVLEDELFLRDVDSIFDKWWLEDFDQNKIPDIRIVVNQGSRSYYTNFNLYVLDFKNFKIKKIESFEFLNAPFFDQKTQSIKSILGGPGEKLSPKQYTIDYKNFRLKTNK